MDNVSIAVVLANNLATFTQRNKPFGGSLCKNVRFQVSEIVEEVEKSWQSDLRNVILGKAKALHQSTGVLALFSSFFFKRSHRVLACERRVCECLRDLEALRGTGIFEERRLDQWAVRGGLKPF